MQLRDMIANFFGHAPHVTHSDARYLKDPEDLPISTTTIIKVQPSAVDRNYAWMLYARGFHHVRLVKAVDIPDWVKEALGEQRKAYFLAKVGEDGAWEITGRVADERW